MSNSVKVKPYLELRAETQARERGLKEKVMSLEEAAALINDGDHVAIGGCTMSRTPMAMIWSLIRAGKKNLIASRSIMSLSIIHISEPTRRRGSWGGVVWV